MESWKEELYHHGIQGQKWGVRRYQNSDGSLTAAGKKHVSQKANIKSSNDSAASSGGGGGGGGAEEEEEELTDEEKEIVDKLVDPETWGNNRSTEGIRRVVDNFDIYLEENLSPELASSLTKGQKEKMKKAAYKELDKRDGGSRTKSSAGGKSATRLRKELDEDFMGYEFNGQKSGAEKLHNRKLTHSDSSKAYVGTLGMKWKISN